MLIDSFEYKVKIQKVFCKCFNFNKEISMTTQEAKREECPTCMGKKIIEGRCEVSGEWENAKTADGQICTPDNTCPTCKGKGFVGN